MGTYDQRPSHIPQTIRKSNSSFQTTVPNQGSIDIPIDSRARLPITYMYFSVMPACGETVKQNLTYLIQAETQAPNTMFCSYTICPVSSDVNRIRLDFTVSCFEIEAKLSFST